MPGRPAPDPALPSVPDALRDWFQRAQEVGLLGPAAVDDHIAHAARFRDALVAQADPPARALDLGTGAGLPGLVLAAWWPESSWLLMDGKQKRASMLSQAVRDLGSALAWNDRVEVRCGRAEAMAREPAWREQFDVVVARSFGPPAVVAECASGFLRVGGRLAVSEPPPGDPQPEPAAARADAGRWTGAPVGELGLAVGSAHASIQLLVKTEPTPMKYPRRIGMPAKRPLF